MRAHLACIVVAVAAVFGAVGLLSAREALRSAARDAEDATSALAATAARTVAASIATGQDQLVTVARLPSVPAVLSGAVPCQLSFELELFPRSRLDIIGPDGIVACSSAPTAVGTAHGDRAWFAEVRRSGGFASSRPRHDPVSGGQAVTFGLALPGADGQPGGAAAIVLAPTAVAPRLAETLGGQRFDFALVDGATRTVLASSDPARAAVGEREPAGGIGGDLAGIRLVPGTRWRVVASIEREAALGPVESLVRRGALAGLAALAVLLASLAVVSRRIARPLRVLTEAISARAGSTQDALGGLRAPVEITRLARSFDLAEAVHEAFQGKLVHQALHDPLTGLPNRVLLAERLAHSLEQASRSGEGVGVLFLDLDGFKLINDSLGHAVGDQVLLATATRLDGILRASDTLARFGGDEFVIVGEGLRTRAQAERLAVRAMTALQAPIAAAGTTVRVSASIGIATSTPSSTASDLVRDADNAMHLAKERGRARHEVFDRPLRERVTRRHTVANELRAALERDELRLVYQPQVDLATRRTTGVEALLRWDHPALGAVSPATFIPIAEDIGMMLPIGRFVLEAACRQAADWRRQGLDLPVSVNLSGRQLAEQGVVDQVWSLLSRLQVPPAGLCLELTESVLMSDVVRSSETLDELHELGVRLSIDDFGTGYSSLAYLHRFPVDELKIDRAFVQGLPDRPDQRTLVTAMVALGSALGLGIVAEGVETDDQAAVLRGLGCPTAQGYLFAEPMAARELGVLLHRDGVEGRRLPGRVATADLDLR